VKAFVRNPEVVARLVMVGAAAGGAVMVIVKLPVAVDTPVAEREIADNAPVAAPMGTVPEITPLVLLIVK
jgi:hypothetical protein